MRKLFEISSKLNQYQLIIIQRINEIELGSHFYTS